MGILLYDKSNEKWFEEFTYPSRVTEINLPCWNTDLNQFPALMSQASSPCLQGALHIGSLYT